VVQAVLSVDDGPLWETADNGLSSNFNRKDNKPNPNVLEHYSAYQMWRSVRLTGYLTRGFGCSVLKLVDEWSTRQFSESSGPHQLNRQANMLRLVPSSLDCQCVTCGLKHITNRCCDSPDRLAIPHCLDRETAYLIGLSRKATNSKGGPQIASKP
jgi:hypothetical protein